jgi:spoIIIJ-associated protein
MDYLKQVTTGAQDLINQLGFSDSVTLQVKYNTEGDTYQVLFQTENPSLLIGYHGENLSSMQLILAQHLHTQTSVWLNLSLNVNDYRERRQFTLHSLADTAVSRVIATGQPHSLPPMPASERRIIHLYLADHPRVLTSSQGAGKTRSVIVSPKS